MRKGWLWIFLLGIIGMLVAAALYYAIFLVSAFEVPDKFDFRLHEEMTLEETSDSLQQLSLKYPGLFEFLSRRMNYTDKTLKPGLYEISPDMSLVGLIRHLRSGKQKPVNVTINSVRTIPELAGKLTRNLELDSLTFLTFLRDSNLIHDTLMTRFIPNTYSVFWNIRSDQLLDRMDRERRSFFDKKDRRKLADSVGLTPTEVYILASIVEKESTLSSEKPTIASVYLNRLKRGIKLQADPTVVFANLDFGIRRVLNKHLAIDSPYNTYKFAGLPPGPICMPSISSLEAVMNPAETDYIFFCAKPGYRNGHAFASTLRQHNHNARIYREWLQQEGIR